MKGVGLENEITIASGKWDSSQSSGSSMSIFLIPKELCKEINKIDGKILVRLKRKWKENSLDELGMNRKS